MEKRLIDNQGGGIGCIGDEPGEPTHGSKWSQAQKINALRDALNDARLQLQSHRDRVTEDHIGDMKHANLMRKIDDALES